MHLCVCVCVLLCFRVFVGKSYILTASFEGQMPKRPRHAVQVVNARARGSKANGAQLAGQRGRVKRAMPPKKSCAKIAKSNATCLCIVPSARCAYATNF